LKLDEPATGNFIHEEITFYNEKAITYHQFCDFSFAAYECLRDLQETGHCKRGSDT
jgi:hypothetical protein